MSLVSVVSHCFSDSRVSVFARTRAILHGGGGMGQTCVVWSIDACCALRGVCDTVACS